MQFLLLTHALMHYCKSSKPLLSSSLCHINYPLHWIWLHLGKSSISTQSLLTGRLHLTFCELCSSIILYWVQFPPVLLEMFYPQPICLLSPIHVIVSEAEMSSVWKLQVEVYSSTSTLFRKIPNPCYLHHFFPQHVGSRK